MPGKVNPVICESMIQVCAQVIGNDMAITIGGQGGVFELNLMLPLIAHNLTQSIIILTTGSQMFTDKLIKNLQANEEICSSYIEGSLAMCTALAPIIGYDRAAEIAQKAKQKIGDNRSAKPIVTSRRHICLKRAISGALCPATTAGYRVP